MPITPVNLEADHPQSLQNENQPCCEKVKDTPSFQAREIPEKQLTVTVTDLQTRYCFKSLNLCQVTKIAATENLYTLLEYGLMRAGTLICFSMLLKLE